MDQQMDTLKVCKHFQHARLQNEDDMWISSEDLRTEGSSDEDTQHKCHGLKRNKKLKQSESILNTSKDIFSIAPKFSELLELPTKDGDCSSAKLTGQGDKSLLDKTTDSSTDRCPSAYSKFLPDLFLDSTPGTSGLSLGSSDADMDALNLESRWRPKRGSLKYPMLVEGQTTENYIHEVKGFYDDLMGKLKSLRNCPAIARLPENETINTTGSKLFKHLKHTPEVQEKMKYIEQLDSQIKETIQAYKTERSERLQIQDELCNEIYKNKPTSERDGQLFLEMCQFEANDDTDGEKAKDLEDVGPTDTKNRREKNTDLANNFIKRNIELAKEGVMAGFSLTDEEKRTLADLLIDVDNVADDDDGTKSRDEDSNKNFYIEEDEDSDSENCCISNAYIMSEDEKKRLDDIDNELEKFTLDETDKEKVDPNPLLFRQREWKDILLEHRLKNIDSQLTELYKSYDNESPENDDSATENVDSPVESVDNDCASVSDSSETEKP